MANALDSLLFSINADTTQLKDALADVQKQLDSLNKSVSKNNSAIGKSADKAGSAGKSAADSFANFRKEALGAFAVLTGGASLKAFISDISQTGTALENLSQKLNIPVKQIGGLRNALKANGLNPQDGDNFLSFLQSESSTNDGRMRLNRLGQNMGVEFINPNGELNHNIVEQLAHSRKFQEEARRGPATAQNYLGQAHAEGLYNLLISKDFDRDMKEGYKNAMTDAEAEKAKQLNHDLSVLQVKSAKVLYEIFEDIEPTLDRVVRGIANLEDNSHDFVKGVTELSIAFGALRSLKIVAWVAELTTGFDGLALGLSRLTGPLGMIAGLIGLIASKNPPPEGIDMLGQPRPDFRHQKSEKWEMAESYFEGQGISKAGSKALADRMIAESNGDPNATGDGGNAHGIFQWHAPRLKHFKEATGKDFDHSDFYDQLTFAAYELNHGEKKARDILNDAGTFTGDEEARIGALQYTRPKAFLDAEKRAGITNSTTTAHNTQIHHNNSWFQPSNSITNNINTNITGDTSNPERLGQGITRGIKSGLDRKNLLHQNNGRVQ